MYQHFKFLLYSDEAFDLEKQTPISSLFYTYCVLKNVCPAFETNFSNDCAIFDFLSFFIGKSKSGGDAYIIPAAKKYSNKSFTFP